MPVNSSTSSQTLCGHSNFENDRTLNRIVFYWFSIKSLKFETENFDSITETSHVQYLARKLRVTHLKKVYYHATQAVPLSSWINSSDSRPAFYELNEVWTAYVRRAPFYYAEYKKSNEVKFIAIKSKESSLRLTSLYDTPRHCLICNKILKLNLTVAKTCFVMSYFIHSLGHFL